MSDLSASVAQAMGTPEDLVVRSATARAAAQGVSVDDVLASWSGGAPVAASAAPSPAEPEMAPAEAAPAEPEPAPAAAEAVAEPAALAPIAVAVLEDEEPEESIEAGSMRDRLMRSGRIGAILGAMFGVLAVVASTRFGLSATTLAGTEDAPQAVLLAEPSKLLLYAAIVSAVFGALVARTASVVPAWFDRGLEVRTSLRTSTIAGGGLGAVLGVAAAGVLLGLGEPVDQLSPEDPALVALGVVSTLVTVVAGGAVLGAVTAGLTQALALPAGLTEAEEAESDVIKHRLATSYLMPLMVIVGILVLVLPFAYLLVSYHSMAPLIAMVAAAGILGFAGLSASRPGMRITVGEFFVAAIGIGVVLLFIVLLANAWSHGDEGGDHALGLVVTYLS